MQNQYKAYANAIKNAQDELVIKYQPALRAMAFRLKERLPASIDVNDLISIGTEELIKLSRKYDESLNDNFWGYSKKRVYGAMLDYLRSLDPLSRSDRKIIKDIEALSNEYFNEFDKEPSDEYLSEKLNIDVEKIKEAKLANSISYLLPIDEQIELAGNDENYLEKISKDDLIEKVFKILKTFNEREQLIIQLYFYEELNLKEIGEILNVSESRVHQLQTKIIKTLREAFKDG